MDNLISSVYIIGIPIALLFFFFKKREEKRAIIDHDLADKALSIVSELAENPALTDSVLYEIALFRQIRKRSKKTHRIF